MKSAAESSLRLPEKAAASTHLLPDQSPSGYWAVQQGNFPPAPKQAMPTSLLSSGFVCVSWRSPAGLKCDLFFSFFPLTTRKPRVHSGAHLNMTLYPMKPIMSLLFNLTRLPCVYFLLPMVWFTPRYPAPGSHLKPLWHSLRVCFIPPSLQTACLWLLTHKSQVMLPQLPVLTLRPDLSSHHPLTGIKF